MKCRNALDDVETGGGRFSRDKHGSGPGGCPRGIRHLDGAKSDQALVWNVRTCRSDAKGEALVPGRLDLSRLNDDELSTLEGMIERAGTAVPPEPGSNRAVINELFCARD